MQAKKRIVFLLKNIYLIIWLLLTPFYSQAFQAEVLPDSVNPGDVLLIKVRAETTALPELGFLNKKFPFYLSFYPVDERNFVALVPVDMDTPAGEYTVTIKNGEEIKLVSIKVRAYEFPESHLTLPEEKVTLSPEDQMRADKEGEMLQALWGLETPWAWSGRFMPPLDTELSAVFGVRRIMNGKKNSTHKGVDYRGKIGTPVRAINSGKVVLSEDLFYGGNTLIIDHGMGLYSIYMHLSEFNISKGQQIDRGDIVGLVGKTGRASGPHLHISVRLRGVSVNPVALLNLEL